MKKEIGLREILFVASMFFGMLFGAGNLIFPVSMGQKAGVEILRAAWGFCITGVGLPLLSVVAMAISKTSSLTDMASFVGRGFALFFTTILYLCIGPLFAIPRTATVPFQVGIVPYLAEEMRKPGLFLFSLFFFFLALLLSLKPGKLLTYVGKILNPIFLLFLSLLLLTAILFPMGKITTLPAVSGYENGSFLKGLFEGYNTMDILGALAFGNVLIQTIRTLQEKNGEAESTETENIKAESSKMENTEMESAGGEPWEKGEKREEQSLPVISILSGSIAAVMMVIIYFALTYAGAQSRIVFSVQENGGDVLHSLSTYYFKSFGGVLLAGIIFFSCLKTAVGLITSAAMAFVEMFPRSLPYKAYVCIFTFFSFAISNVGLSKIISYSVPALFFIYPLSIVLILLCLFGRFFSYDGTVFRVCIYLTLPFAFLDSLKILLERSFLHLDFVKCLLKILGNIPLFKIGLTWLLPSLLGFILGLILCYTKKSGEKIGVQ